MSLSDLCARFSIFSALQCACLVVATCIATPAAAQSSTFDVGVVPARFELSAKSSERLGQSLEVINQSSQMTELSVRTLDWDFSEKGELKFYDELRPGSCREWVTLQRRTLKVAGRNKATFRFQVDVPANAAIGECRFMLAIEGVQPAFQSMLQNGSASLSLPVNGRIAVAVYVAVNGAQPVFTVQQASMSSFEGQRLPAVTVTNSGNAHGRLEGALDAKDASGQSFELVPDGSPLMPGQTRTLALTPRSLGGAGQIRMTYPVTTSGTLDWDNGSFKVNAEFK